ncbi:MAG: LacI family DNA-binding transcriptional regulator [Rhodoluna sp.]
MRVNEKAATIYDIAKLAGVNPSTVSRALTTPGRINAATEAKVREAAKQLNYRVNPFARALPTGKTKMIALMVADITNPVFFKLVRGAEIAAAEVGYTLVIAESQESSRVESDTLERILPSVDGVILGTTRLSDEEIYAVNREKPVVLVNRKVEGVLDVVPNNAPGIDEAVAHLADLGHKHIAFVAGPSASWINTDRWNLLMKSAVDRGMTIAEIGTNEPTVEGGKKSFDRVRAAGATAVVTYNDLMAIGLLRAATEAGVKVPQDLSIVGFDNIFGSDFTNPPLSTIEMPLQEIGREAVETLLEDFDSQDGAELKSTDAVTALLVRGSTGQAKA